MTGIDMVHVPYRGGAGADRPARRPGAGDVRHHAGIDPAHQGGQAARAGGDHGDARWTLLPDVPTVGEFLPGYEASAWYGIGAPKDTPADIVDKLNREINAALADPKIKARLAELGGGRAGSPAEFGKLIADETEKWAKVVRAADIKVQ